jgi:hypothetical protein
VSVRRTIEPDISSGHFISLEMSGADQGGVEAPACSLIARRRFAHHRSIAFSAARIASRLAPPIEPSRGLGGV